MEILLYAAVGRRKHQHGLEASTEYGDLTVAAVGTPRHPHGLEASTVYGDPTVCSCRYSKASAWVRNMY